MGGTQLHLKRGSGSAGTTSFSVEDLPLCYPCHSCGVSPLTLLCRLRILGCTCTSLLELSREHLIVRGVARDAHKWHHRWGPCAAGEAPRPSHGPHARSVSGALWSCPILVSRSFAGAHTCGSLGGGLLFMGCTFVGAMPKSGALFHCLTVFPPACVPCLQGPLGKMAAWHGGRWGTALLASQTVNHGCRDNGNCHSPGGAIRTVDQRSAVAQAKIPLQVQTGAEPCFYQACM